MRRIAITTAAVAGGGALGALIRFLTEVGGEAMGVAGWVVILIINSLGCVAMGFLFYWLESRLRRDGQGLLRHLHVRHSLQGTRGILNEDPTLPAPELARFHHRLATQSGFLLTGLIGGFTTFSSFGLDVVMLIESGSIAEAALDITLSIGLGITGIVIGLEIGRRTLSQITPKC
ncbi:MAG: hypothetical protein HOO04_07830 [Phycisphaerae bacterium]|nr:hypothetical protein [Phycisphaerae bacterium]